MNKFPDTALALLLELERRHPEKVASPKTSRDEDLFYGGKRELIRHIREWYEKSKADKPTAVHRPRR